MPSTQDSGNSLEPPNALVISVPIIQTRSPCVIFEDDQLLVVHKPPGWNTHAPSPYAGEGLYEWLRHREPRWSSLSILHRLDKETSGLIVFGKSPEANRSLTQQFERREVDKTYRLLTDRPISKESFTVVSAIVRNGDHYLARPTNGAVDLAETEFQVLSRQGPITELEARPKTGRTHQIRVHAAHQGIPILGDSLYGGTSHSRLHLAAIALRFQHPESAKTVAFSVPHGFDISPFTLLRHAVIDPEATDAFRLRHGEGNAEAAGCYRDALGDYQLIQSEVPPTLLLDPDIPSVRGVFYKRLNRHLRTATTDTVNPCLLAGTSALDRFTVRENGVSYELSFNEGYSVGLFLDQRDNRRRLLTHHIGADFPLFPSYIQGCEVLNCFSYTCAFSVCAALGGARTTSLDLSKKYLEWGRRNFKLNSIDPTGHDFIFGDVFDWLRRLGKKGSSFDVILLDPPTFSRSKEHGDFRAERDYGSLITSALSVLKPGGVLFASTNAARLEPERFLEDIREAIKGSGRRIQSQLYVPQPPDFPISRAEPAYLKTVWLRVL
ncbi:MAG: hypothetical protein EXS25_11200 [Pedosphaera sp.]|nr:hypothetical protein [Pedosphaera sp.]